jgi:hypothetical protein
MNTDKEYQKAYLDYVNNFLTLACFAEHYQLTEAKAQKIITRGYWINEHSTN